MSLVIHCYITFWNVIARLAIRNIKISQDIINFWLLKEEWLLNRIIIFITGDNQRLYRVQATTIEGQNAFAPSLQCFAA